ncbi:MAG: D-glucuronyl C5-epimerase family protein [Candidatus Woesearchaeota archaeon]
MEISKNEEYIFLENYAIRMAEWLIEIQMKDGAFPGGLYYNYKKGEKSIFNTAQIMLGLIEAWQRTNEKKYIDSAYKAMKWLSSEQEKDGSWIRYNYNENFFPSYYTRVAWPMLQTAIITEDKNSKMSAIKTLDLINNRVKKNSFIQNSGFSPNSYAFLHTIAYTIRGFLESYLLINKEEYFNTAFNLAYKFMRKYELRKRLAGAYYENFEEINWYRCLTGEAQISIIWFKIFALTNDVRFVSAASKLLDDTSAQQPLKNTLFLKAGGLKGSQPYYGRYIAFRQPNWATKFYIDALLLEDKAYKKITKVLNL